MGEKAQLREPAPVLPWLFSSDVSFVLDARDKPRVAFSYVWRETAPDGTVTDHLIAVPYETSVPLLCTFAAPPAARQLTGSFFASSGDQDGVNYGFYRGMTPSALMQRRKQRAAMDDDDIAP